MVTNATRLLTAAKIEFSARSYPVDESDLSGVHVAALLDLPPERVFKTLVVKGARTGLFVCLIPAGKELDLKKAARAAGDKSCEMLPMKDLLAATGYVRGGCSPVGMKKKLPTYIDETCQLFDEIAVNAGARGTMLLIEPGALIDYVGARLCDLLSPEVSP